jgi:uncharacterized protein (TIGR00299 family) protein
LSRTLAWFHCYAGIAGDMAFGSLIDAGADFDDVLDIVGRLPVKGWSVETEPVMRSGLAATHMLIETDDASVVRTYAHIVGLIEEARLPDRVRDRALATLDALAAVEGHLHRRHPSQVHFHEVGGLDAIIDVVGTCAALEVLGVDDVYGSPVATGIGVVRSAHGLLPNPAPAVVALLAGAPTYGRDVPVELTTPTGAALLTSMAVGWGPMPPMTITATGFGAGTRDLDDLPNSTQVVIGTAATASVADRAGQPLMLLETNVDDATGETLAHAVAALLDAGAHDAWLTPVVMKKGRPAYTVSALCDTALSEQVSRVLVSETGTLGLRGQIVERWAEKRMIGEVQIDGRPVRVKISPGRIKVEHDDAARAARHTGIPLRDVISLAEEAARRSRDDGAHGQDHPAGSNIGGEDGDYPTPPTEPPSAS